MDKHLRKQREQRAKYYENKLLATTQKDKYISMIVDGMDQRKTYLPIASRREKSDELKLIKQKIMGVKVKYSFKYLKLGSDFGSSLISFRIIVVIY